MSQNQPPSLDGFGLGQVTAFLPEDRPAPGTESHMWAGQAHSRGLVLFCPYQGSPAYRALLSPFLVLTWVLTVQAEVLLTVYTWTTSPALYFVVRAGDGTQLRDPDSNSTFLPLARVQGSTAALGSNSTQTLPTRPLLSHLLLSGRSFGGGMDTWHTVWGRWLSPVLHRLLGGFSAFVL